MVDNGHTQVHDVVSANGTIIDNDIPSPEGYGVPLGERSVSRSEMAPKVALYLLDLKLLLAVTGVLRYGLAFGRGARSGILHFHVRHDVV